MQGSSPVNSALLQSLISQGPYLLALVVGLIVSGVFLARYRLPAMLAASGFLLQILATFGSFLVQAWFMREATGGAGMRVTASLAAVIYMALSLVRAAGLGVLLAAVFVGRGGASSTDSFVKK